MSFFNFTSPPGDNGSGYRLPAQAGGERRSGVLDFVPAPAAPVLTAEMLQAIENQALANVNAELGPQLTAADIDNPDPALHAQVESSARRAITRALTERKIPYSTELDQRLVQSIMHKLMGYGWLEPLLPPRRDVTEIMLNPDGTVWVIPRGSSQPERVAEAQPSPADANLVIGKILAGANRRATEAEPEVSAKLPRSTRFPTGARVHVIIPPVANGTHPALNIRFYEAEPVRPETLLAWGALSAPLFQFLTDAVRAHRRVMIAGGTGTGKTTLLSAIANFIPPEERILLIEDPAEIVLDHPQIVSLEARPPSLDGKYAVTMSELVNAAMRMTPKWLIVGEVRHGSAGASLFSAQMSDHPGLSTIHALSPKAALSRLSLLMHLDPITSQVGHAAIKELIAQALDLLVQIEYVNGVRRITRVVEVAPELRGGEVYLTDLWAFDAATVTWKQVGQLTRER